MKNTTKKETNIPALIEKINPTINNAQSIKISTQSEMEQATEVLSRLNKFLDNITEEKEKITKPMNEALKEVRTRYKPIETTLSEAISIIRSKMSKYQTEQIALKKQEEAKILEKVASGKLKIETGSAKLANLSTPPPNTQSDSGSVRFRTDKVLHITDPLKIPREYLIPDEKALLSSLKLGNIIPGCEIEEVQTPINNR